MHRTASLPSDLPMMVPVLMPQEAAFAGAGSIAASGIASARDNLLHAYVEHLAFALRNLSQAVHTGELRQVEFDQRISDFSGRLQGLSEEVSALASGQKTVAVSVKRALHTAVTMQRQIQEDEIQAILCPPRLGCSPTNSSVDRAASAALGTHELCDRLLEQERRLAALGEEVAALAGRVATAQTCPSKPDTLEAEALEACQSALIERISSLERGQKKVAFSARRALETIANLVEQQQLQEADGHQEIKQLRELCDELSGKVRISIDDSCKPSDCVATLRGKVEEQAEVVDDLQGRVDCVIELREKVDEVEHAMMCLAARHMDEPRAQMELQNAHGPDLLPDMAVDLRSLEARFERRFHELSEQLEAMQDSRDEQRVVAWQLSRQVPDILGRVDQLWDRCQHYFSKVTEHDAKLAFARASLENSKRDDSSSVDPSQQPERDDDGSDSSLGGSGLFGPSLFAPMLRDDTDDKDLDNFSDITAGHCSEPLFGNGTTDDGASSRGCEEDAGSFPRLSPGKPSPMLPIAARGGGSVDTPLATRHWLLAAKDEPPGTLQPPPLAALAPTQLRSCTPPPGSIGGLALDDFLVCGAPLAEEERRATARAFREMFPDDEDGFLRLDPGFKAGLLPDGNSECGADKGLRLDPLPSWN